MKTVSRSACRAALILLGPLFLGSVLTGCASNQALRLSVQDRDAEIRTLHEEQTALQAELARTRSERDGLQVALEEAAIRLDDRSGSQAQPVPRFPDLDAEGITYGRRGGNVVFSVPAAVTFGSGQASLTDGGKKALTTLARRLKSEFGDQAVFHVEGHTDSDPIRKSNFESNRDLSLERAKAVHGYLVTQCKIEDERFVLVGHGQYRPVAPNDSKANKAKNRRVEIVVHAGP